MPHGKTSKFKFQSTVSIEWILLSYHWKVRKQSWGPSVYLYHFNIHQITTFLLFNSLFQLQVLKFFYSFSCYLLMNLIQIPTLKMVGYFPPVSQNIAVLLLSKLGSSKKIIRLESECWCFLSNAIAFDIKTLNQVIFTSLSPSLLFCKTEIKSNLQISQVGRNTWKSSL